MTPPDEARQNALFELGDHSTPEKPMPSRRKKAFCNRQEPHSAVKATIVLDYFGTWAKIPQPLSRRATASVLASVSIYARQRGSS
jgi:hypothetical protein